MRDPDLFDFFISYSRADNWEGWVTTFANTLADELQRLPGASKPTFFFDTTDIRSLDDWRHRIYSGLAGARLFVPFVSPNYFLSEWCRREWRSWIDIEIAKHILSAGAAPIYIVEIEGLLSGTEPPFEVAARICAGIGNGPDQGRKRIVKDSAAIMKQIRRRQFMPVQGHFQARPAVPFSPELNADIAGLAGSLRDGLERVKAAAKSESTIPPPNKRFTGRLEQLYDLRENMTDDRAGVICGVHGLGGIGKTELAFTYAHAFGSDYPGGRFYVPCENKASMNEALLHLDAVFGQAISDHERKRFESHVAAVQRCLRERVSEHGRVLLVLDNIEDEELLTLQQVDSITHIGPLIHLLATTRTIRPVNRAGHWIVLEELELNEALELLEKFRGFSSQSEEASAKKIVLRLGGYTLAIELLGAFLECRPDVSYGSLADSIGLEDLESIAATQDVELRRHNHERRLSAVLSPTLRSLSKEETLALEYAALLAPDHVPLSWLKVLVGQVYPPLVQNSALGSPWRQLLDRLERLGLFTRVRASDTPAPIVRIHRLVQAMVKRSMSDQERTKREEQLTTFISNRIEELKRQPHWRENSWELDPLLELGFLWSGDTPRRAAFLLVHVGGWLMILGRFTNSETALRLSMTNANRPDEPYPEVVPTVFNNLGQVLKATARYSEAKVVMEQALDFAERTFGPDHPHVARELNNLAQLLRTMQRPAVALPLLRRCLRIMDDSVGRKDGDTIRAMTSLANCLVDCGESNEAVAISREALILAESLHSHTHPLVGTVVATLARSLEEIGLGNEALPLMRRALSIAKENYGDSHYEVAMRLNNLSPLLSTYAEPNEVRSALLEARRINLAVYGKTNPETGVANVNLANFCLKVGDYKEAEQYANEAKESFTATLGSDHPKTATSLKSLALIYLETARHELALQCSQEAVQIDERAFGHSHEAVAEDLLVLGRTLTEQNRSAEAEPVIERALRIATAVYGQDHRLMPFFFNARASLYLRTNRLAQAERDILEALRIDEAGTPNSIDVVRDLNQLALVREMQGQGAPAVADMRRALNTLAAIIGSQGRPFPLLLNVVKHYRILMANQEERPEETVAFLTGVSTSHALPFDMGSPSLLQ